MRVIESAAWTAQVKCPSCGSLLDFEERDVRYGDFGVQYADDHDWRYYVVCGREGCGSHVKFDAVPGHVANAAEMRTKRDVR